MKATAFVVILVTLSAAPYGYAASKENDNPDKEMLRMMELLKDMEMIKQIDMIQDLQKVDPSAANGGAAPSKSAPATKHEASR